MAELILIRMTNRTKETLKNIDILNAASTEKITYDLLMPGDDYKDLSDIFQGGICDKICMNYEEGLNKQKFQPPTLKYKSPLKTEPTLLVPLVDPYQRRANYAQIDVGAEITKEYLLQAETLIPESILLIGILFS